MKSAIKLDDDVRDVLNRSVVEGNILRLPPGQLERKLYERTNKALEALGGSWNRKAKGHIFAADPRAAIAAAGEEGKVAHPNAHDFFPTSTGLAEAACKRLQVPGGWLRTLEPSAGEGDLVAPLFKKLGRPTQAQLQLIETDPRRCAALRSRDLGEYLMTGDFLGMRPAAFLPFDRILMNPPFHMGADAAHIGHALNFLAPGGRLVAIASAGFGSRGTKTTKSVRDLISAWGGTIEDLPEGSFKEAGTNVATVLVSVDRPRAS